MVGFILRRLATSVVVLFLVSLLTFALVHMVPGDAAVVAAGENASDELIQQARERLGLDKPLLVQYAAWVGGVLTGDLGTSLFSSQSAASAVVSRIPATVSLTVLAMLWATVAGVALGIAAALRPHGWVDRATTWLATVGVAMPSFWIGLILVTFLAIQNPWLPATGYRPLTTDPIGWLSHLALPAIALGTTCCAEIARHTRASVATVLSRDFVRTAVAKGLSKREVLVHHVLRNAAMPIVTVFGIQLAQMISGAIVVEQVFGLPGLGTFAIEAVISRDFPFLQAFVLLTTGFVIVINAVVDMSYAYFNPKLRRVGHD